MQIYRLRPGFELMGNPSHLFSDFNNDTQVEMWRDLVRQVASRYIGRLKRVSRLLNVPG
jgi:L-iduronidase